MRRHTVFVLDITLIISTLALVIIGILFIYSSGISSTGIVNSKEYIRQIVWAGSGVALMLLFSFVDYNRLRHAAIYIYGFFILLLIITLFFGTVVNGAKSWLGILNFGIQPSEFAKIATIILLSSYYHNTGKKVDALYQYFIGFGIVLLPMILILIQPDMGTASCIPSPLRLAAMIQSPKRNVFLQWPDGFTIFPPRSS